MMRLTGGEAVIHLRGHGSRPATLDVVRYSPLVWLTRVLRYTFGWIGATAATLVITFDPFVASFPFVIGIGYLYRTVRGRYDVRHFEGRCPRCESPLTLEPGSKIPLPLDMVCYVCHHEPELRLAAG